MTAVVVVAKHPVPGRVKTRLHPPLTLEAAAAVAAASLDDTLLALAGAGTRRILYSDDGHLPAVAAGWESWRQPEGPLDERLARLLDRLDEPMILVGMDTPQLGPALRPALEEWPEEVDAWFGPALDGGFWALGLRRPAGDLVRGVPMSRADTGERTVHRLMKARLRMRRLPPLRDIDGIVDLVDVARAVPTSRTAAAFALAARAAVPAAS
jgi:glycosyltransferase A (GT-A) superfamily protein (DUF2064 family)